MTNAKDVIEQLKERFPLFAFNATESGAVEVDLYPTHPSRVWIDEVNRDVLAMLDRAHQKLEGSKPCTP